MKIINKGSRHICRQPGSLKRWVKKLGNSAIIQCDCGEYYKFKNGYWYPWFVYVAGNSALAITETEEISPLPEQEEAQNNEDN